MRVAILGCGYVGLELARQLTPDHEVIGVRRSKLDVVRETGAQAVEADVTDADALAEIPDVDALVFAASSGGRGAEAAREVYVEGLETAIDAFADRESSPDQLVYTSSTGVYGDHDGNWVDESTPIEPTTEKTAVLAEAERIATEYAAERGIDGTVARFAGLYGPDRYRLDRYLEGPVTAGYLNMIHRDDAAGAVAHLLDGVEPSVVNVADDEPASKHDFADWLADQCDVPRPDKRTKQERLDEGDLSEPAQRRILTSKRVSNDLLHEVGYELDYPTYREGYAAAVAAYRERNR
ncbi:SDR family oxidoreductase [Halosegnis longus]|uniref:SDR family oxidoreductase n=1 Tax=Halosegnis longus TaxID=2216012 RepID=A0AAJ4RA03_9EURY|nr:MULTISPECIES: SDR family oxidoreductase [Halobacteriales]RNJ26980.1 SDR family oxidoreductase [Salella cibi]